MENAPDTAKKEVTKLEALEYALQIIPHVSIPCEDFIEFVDKLQAWLSK